MPRNAFLIWNALAAVISCLVTVFGAYAVASAVLGHISGNRGLVLAAAVAAAGAAAGTVLHRCRTRSELD
jgi:membrane protein DedA with SNARE-associated domain